MKKIFQCIIVFFLLVLTGCASNHQPLKRGQGYVVLDASNGHYRIEYFSKSAKDAETQWQVTAHQLCPAGFESLYSTLVTVQFDMRVPIAGNNVNLGRQEYIYHGEIVCGGSVSPVVHLTQSPWREFNRETNAVKPVSVSFLNESLKMSAGYFDNLPHQAPTAALTKIFGKPAQQEKKSEQLISVWRNGGDNWFPNQVVVMEQRGCLSLVMILPGVSAYMVSLIEKQKLDAEKIKIMLLSGLVPAYFYLPTLPLPEACRH